MTSTHVPSLELCKKLRDLGWKKDTMFWWIKGRMDYGYEGEWHIVDGDEYFIFDHIVSHRFQDYDFEVSVDVEKFGSFTVEMTDDQFSAWFKEEARLKQLAINSVIPAPTVGEMMPEFPKGTIFRSEITPDEMAEKLCDLLENNLVNWRNRNATKKNTRKKVRK